MSDNTGSPLLSDEPSCPQIKVPWAGLWSTLSLASNFMFHGSIPTQWQIEYRKGVNVQTTDHGDKEQQQQQQ